MMRKRSLPTTGDSSRFFQGHTPARRSSPFISWRAWQFDIESQRLRSLTSDTVWDGPVCTTRLLKNGQPEKPTWVNHAERIKGYSDAGVYSYKTPGLLAEYLSGYPVYGRLENYGHVIEHELGYRSQKVVIQELFLVNMPVTISERVWTPKECRELESLYGCEVKTGNFADWINQQEKEWVR